MDSTSTVPAEAPKNPKGSFGNFLFYLLIVVITSAIVFLGVLFLRNIGVFPEWSSSHHRYPAVVLLNENRVFRTVSMSAHNPKAAFFVGKAVSLVIQSTISRYNRHGTVVITSGEDVSVPSQDNITQPVIREIQQYVHTHH